MLTSQSWSSLAQKCRACKRFQTGHFECRNRSENCLLLPNGRRSECTSTLQGVRAFDLAELVPLLFPPPLSSRYTCRGSFVYLFAVCVSTLTLISEERFPKEIISRFPKKQNLNKVDCQRSKTRSCGPSARWKHKTPHRWKAYITVVLIRDTCAYFTGRSIF